MFNIKLIVDVKNMPSTVHVMMEYFIIIMYILYNK